MEYTKTPWVAMGRYVGVPNHKSFIAECRDQNGNWSEEPMALANAGHIVNCVNSYDALIQACQAAVDYLANDAPAGRLHTQLLAALKAAVKG